VVVDREFEVAVCHGGCGYRPLVCLRLEGEDVLCDLCGETACGCDECMPWILADGEN